MNYALGSLKRELPCIFGTGKSFLRREASDPLPVGTEIKNRFDDKGWHKFGVIEYGYSTTYAVQSAAILDAALAEDGPSARDLAIAEIKRLMTEHDITVDEFGR
jgi:hypothetical protein